jgi:uncharacterized protein YjiK
MYNLMLKVLFTILVIMNSLIALCQSKKFPEGILYQEEAYHFPYHLGDPDKKTKLPSDLKEISGIQYLGDGLIAGVEDEHGIIYLIDFDSGEIEKEIKFSGKGDYEGLAIVGSTAWVLKSNGELYRVKDYKKGKDDRKIKKFETELSLKNDAEGLAYDPTNNRLLIACKGHPYIDDRDGKHLKGIYAFDLEEKTLDPEPIFLIDLKKIQDIKEYNSLSSIGVNIMSQIDENKGDVSFQPSDIAVHPYSGNYYVIGAVGDLLLVYTTDGKLLVVAELKDQIFKQAEGICFDKDADMYISNEGRDGKANILKFKNKK